MDSNTTSGADASTGSRIRYLRHPTLLLTRAADEEGNLWSSSSRHPRAAVARNTRAIGRELLRTVMTLLMDVMCRNVRYLDRAVGIDCCQGICALARSIRS